MSQIETKQVRLVNDQHEVELSLHDILRLGIENAWLVLIICAATMAGAYWLIKTTPVSYKSTAVLEAEFKDVTLLDFKQFEGEERYRSVELLNTLAASVTRTEVLQRVAKIIHTDAEIKQWITNEMAPEALVAELTLILRDKVEAKVRRQTRFIDVSVIDGKAHYSQRLAQFVVEQYIAAELASKQGSGQGATNFLNTEVDRLRQKLDESQSRLTIFLGENPLSVDPDEDLVSSDLKSLNSKLLSARGERMRLQTDLDQIKLIAGDPEQLLTVPSVVSTPQVAELRKQVLDKENEIVNLQQRYKSKHPKMIEANSLLESLNKKLAIEVQRAPAMLTLEYKKAELKEAQLEIDVKDLQKQVSALNIVRMEYNKLNSSVDSDRQIYENTLKRAREADLNMSILQRDDAKHDISIFENAGLPQHPFRPNKRLIIAFALTAGMGLSFGIIYLIHLLDTTVKSVDQAERIFGVPVLGSIPRSGQIAGDQDRLILSADPNSLCSEAFRTLRAAISLLGRESERKVTLFTSAVPSEGKTFCSSNFALASSMQGKKTLIVDFDLRRPSVGDTFQIDAEKIGVSDCLLGKTSIEEAAIVTEYENLHVLPAGTMVPNPSELISSDHTREFIDEARAKYDQVVIDNAPVTAVSDTLLILNHVDTVCLVSRAAKTSYRLVSRALELIKRGGVQPSGLILNFVPQKGRSGYYYYYNSDKSYYGGYGQKKGQKARA